MSADPRQEVRDRYAEAALGLAAGQGCGCDCESIGCCGDEATTLFGKGLYGDDERADLPEDAVCASLGCGNPLAVTDSARGRDRARPRLRGWDRRFAVGPARRAHRNRLRPRHDRRDARARAAKRRRGPRDERPLPQGPHRGDAASRRERRRGDLELRREPLDRQARVLRRDRARAATWGSRRDHGHRRREPPLSRRACGTGKPCRVHRGCALRGRVPRRADGRGLVDVEVEYTHRVADGMHGAIVRASKPV